MNTVSILVLVAISGAAPASPRTMNNLPPDVSVRFDAKRRTVTRIEGANILRSVPDLAKLADEEPGRAAIAFVSAYRGIFRLDEPGKELRVSAVKPDELGFRHVKLAQNFRGLEVVHGEMLFHFNRDRALYLVTASYIPTPVLSEIKPKLDQAAAVRAAAAQLSTKAGNWPAILKIWSAPSGEGLLAYEVAASVALDQAWRVFVDAHSGRILERISTIHTSSTIVPPQRLNPKAP